MDFKNWRKNSEDNNTEQDAPKVNKFRGKLYHDYIEEQQAIEEKTATG